MRIGSGLVSTEDQTLDLQRDALMRAKCRRVYEEQATGKHTGRPQLEACLKSLREGDTLVVWGLDRLESGRSSPPRRSVRTAKDKFRIAHREDRNRLARRPADIPRFRSLRGSAEFERNLIRERTVASLKTARACGRSGGRHAKLSSKEIKTIRAGLKTADIPVAKIAARFGVAGSTLYRTLEPPA